MKIIFVGLILSMFAGSSFSQNMQLNQATANNTSTTTQPESKKQAGIYPEWFSSITG